MTSSRIAVAASLATCLVACAGSRTGQRSDTAAATRAQAARPAPDRSGATARGVGDVCPMDVPGTQVAASDTAAGEALTFTTTPDQVDELRRRVRAMAAMHDRHMSRQGTGAAGEQQGTQDQGGGHGMMPGSRATAEDVENGVRVEVVPDDPGQADRVRAMVRKHADRMQTQGCGMMHGG